MFSIVTLTLNPTIDASFTVDRMMPAQKIRAKGERYDPGGGGINVARVFVRLGGNARCVYLSGGATGHALDGMLDQHQLVRTRIPIAGQTRMASAIFDLSDKSEYRIVPPGPFVSEAEWIACLAALEDHGCDYLIASGSLPPGVPGDFYARVVEQMTRRGTKVVLDSSGEGLVRTMAAGGVHLVKPNVEELQQIAGRELRSDEEIAAAAEALVRDGRAEMVAVTMGKRGGLLARSGEATLRLPGIDVEARSTVGAGDSFLAAMVYALAAGKPAAEAFRNGIAAGAAAVMRPGTSLAYPEDIARLGAELGDAVPGQR